jgi:hypothetical protein
MKLKICYSVPVQCAYNIAYQTVTLIIHTRDHGSVSLVTRLLVR